jgi:signal transduction histidine kinase
MHRRPDLVRGLPSTYRIDAMFAVLAAAALVARVALPGSSTPVDVAWVGLTLLYGVWLWWAEPRAWRLVGLVALTVVLLGMDIARHPQPLEEMGEDPPMVIALVIVMFAYARRLLAANARLVRLLGLQRQFVRDASHELRTPLTVALGHAQLLHEEVGSTKAAEDAELVIDELQQMSRLADRLLLLASLEDPAALVRVRVDLAEVLRETVGRWRPAARRWVTHKLEAAPVDGDQEALTLGIDALLDNAARATGPDDTIELSVARVGRLVRVTVADRGRGLPEQDVGRIFEPFARTDRGRSRAEGGYGLGLALVRRVAEAHGGRVLCQPRSGGGTSFELWLPLAEAGHHQPS